MIINKILFLEDIRGLNGATAREVAISDIEKYLDYDYTPEQVEELDAEVEELRDDNEELDKENDKLEDEIESLESKIKELTEENRRLKKENVAVGNMLDYVVVERGINIFDDKGLKP